MKPESLIKCQKSRIAHHFFVYVILNLGCSISSSILWDDGDEEQIERNRK